MLPPLERPRPNRELVLGAAVVHLSLAAVGLVIVAVGGDETDADAAVAAVGFGIAIAIPAFLALLALRSRPTLLLPAGSLTVGLAIPLAMGPGVIVAVPGVVYLLNRPRRTPDTGRRRRAAVAAGAFVLAFASGASLVASDDPICWRGRRTPEGRTVEWYVPRAGDRPPADGFTSGGCTSDHVTGGEVALAVLFGGASLVVGGWMPLRPDTAPV